MREAPESAADQVHRPWPGDLREAGDEQPAPADVLGEREEHVGQHQRGRGRHGGDGVAVEAAGAGRPDGGVGGEDRHEADRPGQQERAPADPAEAPAARPAEGAEAGGDQGCDGQAVRDGLAERGGVLDVPDVDALGRGDGGAGEPEQGLDDDETHGLATGGARRGGSGHGDGGGGCHGASVATGIGIAVVYDWRQAARSQPGRAEPASAVRSQPGGAEPASAVRSQPGSVSSSRRARSAKGCAPSARAWSSAAVSTSRACSNSPVTASAPPRYNWAGPRTTTPGHSTTICAPNDRSVGSSAARRGRHPAPPAPT